jgi:RimJ/RimL family protein N-acetyltransferase
MTTFALRPLQKTDADDLFRLAQDPLIWAHTDLPMAKTLEQWREMIAELCEMPWVFAACIGDEVIGSFSLVRQRGQYAHRAEMGGWLGAKFHGFGLGTLAFAYLIDFGKSVGLRRIDARASSDNPSVAKAGLKAGMQLESVVKNGVVRNGTLLDEMVFVWLER